MTRQGRDTPSEGITNVNSVGIPSGLSTASWAPLTLTLRTVQEIAPPPNEIFVPFSTQLRRDPR